MPRRKSTALYRPLLREAFALTWERKRLWIFGIFAALISTGGVLDVALASVKKVGDGGTLLYNLMDTSFIGYDLVGQYIVQLQLLGPQRTGVIITIVFALFVLLITMATISQGGLLLGLKANKTPDIQSLKKEAREHFWPLLGLALTNKVLTGLLVVLLTLPLLLIHTATTQTNIFLFSALILLLLPAIIVLNILYMFSLMENVLRRKNFFHSIEEAPKLFSRQWLATVEYAAILFIVVFFAGLIALSGLLLLAVPYTILFTAIVLTGSITLLIAVNTLFAVAVVGLILALGGASVTFQYAAWYVFFKRGAHGVHGKKRFSKLHRLFHGL